MEKGRNVIKMRKKIIAMIIILVFVLSIVTLVSASSGTATSSQLDTSKFQDITNPSGGDGIYNFGGRIIYIIQYVGYTVAVLVLISIRNQVYGI